MQPPYLIKINMLKVCQFELAVYFFTLLSNMLFLKLFLLGRFSLHFSNKFHCCATCLEEEEVCMSVYGGCCENFFIALFFINLLYINAAGAILIE